MKKKNDTKKEIMKAYKRLKPWSLNFDLNGFTHESLARGEKKKPNNLGPYKEPRIAQTFHYWFQEFLASTPSLKWALVMGVF
jgi:hypothetical protein